MSEQEEVDFSDPSSAFRDKSTWEVARALAILRLCAIDALADNSERVLCWVPRRVLRGTVYAQFVGGDGEEELSPAMRKVRAQGMRAMLAATMEEEEDSVLRVDESVLDRNCDRIVRCVRLSAKVEGEGALVQMKLSGLVRPHLLVSLGHAYSKSRLPLVESIARQLTGTKMSPPQNFLNHEEEEALGRAVERLKKIGNVAASSGVSMLVDAEATPLNDGLSALCLAGAVAFNTRRPVFWNTYQCYLKDALNRVEGEYRLLQEGAKVSFGAKVVRGAYMHQEKGRGVLCEDYNATSRNYDRVVSLLLGRSNARMVVATHNERSIQLAIKRMKEVDNRNVCFGQLYGMGDHISCPLAQAGFAVHKSIPCGSVEEVVPYMARRAQENRSILQGASKEHKLLATEFGRRLRRLLLLRR